MKIALVLLAFVSIAFGVINALTCDHYPILTGIVTALFVFVVGFSVYRSDLWKDGIIP